MPQDKYTFAYTFTAQAEGGFSDVAEDKGGVTAYGVCIELLKSMSQTPIDRAFLQSAGVSLPITRVSVTGLSKDQAKKIFKYEFWDKHALDKYPLKLAALLFDMGVNHGWRNAVKLAQRGYNANLGPYGSKLVVDGIDGLKTKAALQQDSIKLLNKILDARAAFFRAIVENHPSQQKFLKGWLNRVGALRLYLQREV